MKRRSLLFTPLALLGASQAPAAEKRAITDPMRLGVENALVDSGLATQLQRAFARDTGGVVLLVPGTSAGVLAALEQGEVDASMTDAPELEAKLEKQGLAHDRRPVATGELVLLGPVAGKGRKASDPAGVLGERDVVAALARLAQQQARFVSAPEGSGAYLSELALWRAAKVAPAAAWYSRTDAKGDAIALAAGQQAYTLVERGLWASQGRKPLAVLVNGDPRLQLPVHVMRAFRVSHPAAKLFVQWVAGPAGQRIAAGVSGWRAATP